jgi:hypothetical protein
MYQELPRTVRLGKVKDVIYLLRCAILARVFSVILIGQQCTVIAANYYYVCTLSYENAQEETILSYSSIEYNCKSLPWGEQRFWLPIRYYPP